ncbi:MAG: glycosyltransferase [Deltaproteobacteria bacterium]|nr:glycosyltransferase [Deltaproteobacteria bacterium]
MNILIHTVPYMMNATYFIDIGYVNAFRAMGHSVNVLEYGSPFPDKEEFIPDISISYFHIAYSEKTDYHTLAQYKKEKGTRIVIWGSPFNVPADKYTDEHKGLHPQRHRSMMKDDLFDLCITFYPPEGINMYYRHWTDEFGISVLSLPFAADVTVFRPCKAEERYKADLCFFGGIHRTKKMPFYSYIRPLLDKYTMIAVGEGWEGWPVTRISVPYGDEPNILSSTSIIPNVHMDLCRDVPGMAPNMRTFQSIAGGGFVVSDNVPALRHYFQEDEVPVGLTPEDYKEKIDYFIMHPDERHEYWLRAYKRMINEHTYIHRVKSLLEALSVVVH